MVTSSVVGMIVVCVGHISKQVKIGLMAFRCASSSYLKGFEDARSIGDHVLVGQHGAFGVSCKAHRA